MCRNPGVCEKNMLRASKILSSRMNKYTDEVRPDKQSTNKISVDHRTVEGGVEPGRVKGRGVVISVVVPRRTLRLRKARKENRNGVQRKVK